MAITLYHHPFSRASTVLWMLEEVEQPYDLRYVDIMKGEQKSPELVSLNPMGKLPTLVDDGTVVTEGAAIGLYLADRYSYGKLAPKHDDPLRGTYLRWAFFAPSVIEPGAMAKLSGWTYKPGQAGWGEHAAMIQTIEHAISGRDFLLGKQFSMADVVFGGTLRYMLLFKMIEEKAAFTNYVGRLNERPAYRRADARNLEVMQAHGLQRS